MYTKSENIHDLANAIVARACDDYRDALRGNGENPGATKRLIKIFFRSDWYELLTSVGSRMLLRQLDAEWEDGKKLIKVGKGVDCPTLNKPYGFACPLCGGVATATIRRYKTPKRKDGTHSITYRKMFECSCHRPEQILLREEIINHGNNKN